MTDFTVTMNTVPITPQVPWCLWVENANFDELGILKAMFTTHTNYTNDQECKRFILALAEFVKNYR